MIYMIRTNENTLQNQVQEYLVANGIAKKFLAKQLDISPALLSHWFIGRTKFPDSRLNKIREFISRTY